MLPRFDNVFRLPFDEAGRLVRIFTVARLVPAYRALRLDPVNALRTE